MVQSMTSTPADNQSPATESNLREPEPIIVETVLMPTTCDLNGDDQFGEGNPSSLYSYTSSTYSRQQ
jgi:hypothetical protein